MPLLKLSLNVWRCCAVFSFLLPHLSSVTWSRVQLYWISARLWFYHRHEEQHDCECDITLYNSSISNNFLTFLSDQIWLVSMYIISMTTDERNHWDQSWSERKHIKNSWCFCFTPHRSHTVIWNTDNKTSRCHNQYQL